MATRAQSDARALVERIRREHTLDGAIAGTRFESLVRNCLDVLSSQLYEKSTHFLLELLQNADDNTYQCSTPTLKLSYKPGCLRVDCNEVGFTPDNVEAICAVSASTKSGKTSDGEYIGEKGIGFKSVFKAADAVWISSGDFSFKFDKTQFLGMVSPIWADFPEATQPDWTSMYLQLSESQEEDILIDEIQNFDPNLLIFLRRVRCIEMKIVRAGGNIWERKVCKSEQLQDSDRVIALHDGKNTAHYLVRTHVVTGLPKEPKRPNWAQTKVLLAFPLADGREQPRLIAQNVYAFLPIRNYGFKFLLQADFLLTASREDIESTLPWNRHIRDALPDTFLQAIHHFNKGGMKYVWPCYVPSHDTATASFLEPAVHCILSQLADSPILESCAKTMVKPSTLKYIPPGIFADNEGIPFTLDSISAIRYLSMQYPAWAMAATTSFGVAPLSSREFLIDLNSMIAHDPMAFRARPATWHSQLADTLFKLSSDTELMAMIQDLCIVPLQDGEWTSAGCRTIFFSRGDKSLEMPSGIEVVTMSPEAEEDPARRRLFTSLGVKAWEPIEICNLIVDTHQSPDFDPSSLTLSQLVSHALFLYKAAWQPPKTADLWFATTQAGRCRGRAAYLPGSTEAGSATSRIFVKLQSRFPVIHEDYLTVYASDAEWPTWLVEHLGLSMVPRIITPHVSPKPQPIHPHRTIPDLASTKGAKESEDYLATVETDRHALGPGLAHDDLQRQIWDGPSGTLGEMSDLDFNFNNNLDNDPDEEPIMASRASAWRVSSNINTKTPSINQRGNTLGIFQAQNHETKDIAAVSSMEQNLLMKRLCDALNVPRHVALRTEMLFNKTEAANLFQSRWKGAAIACCIFIACRLSNTPCTFEQIHAVGGVSKVDLGRTYKQLEKFLETGRGAHSESMSQTVEPKAEPSGSAGLPPLGMRLDMARVPRPKGSVPKSHVTTTAQVKASSIEEDINKQCGVMMADGKRCRRLLTCKSHSTNSKRAVLGRLEPFDVLLSMYQEKNRAAMTLHNLDESPDVLSARAPVWLKPTIQHLDNQFATEELLSGVSAIVKMTDETLQPSAPAISPTQETISSGDAQPEDPEIELMSSEEVSPVFELSEEFRFMLCKCSSADVLQLIRENWHHYSQWIDGAHMTWQDRDFRDSSDKLKDALGGSLVKSAIGPIPLRETVLPGIDSQLDEAAFVPTLALEQPCVADWKMLGCFGVVISAELQYYLRCLVSFSTTCEPDLDQVTYIYEQIQNRYRGNENLISAAFHERQLIFIQSNPQPVDRQPCWNNMQQCLKDGIDVENSYPSASYLFRCLKSPGGDPIVPLVSAAGLITTTSHISDILRLLRNLSRALKGVDTTKAAQLLRPLQNAPIFPVAESREGGEYDRLVSPRDTSWLIADRLLIYESFRGRLPLLVLPVEDVADLEDLLRVLRLDGRLMSKMVTTKSQPMGRVSLDTDLSILLREKSAFIKAVIPQTHLDREMMMRQMDEARVNVATRISTCYSLVHLGTTIEGTPVSGRVCMLSAGGVLNLVVLQEAATDAKLPFELVGLIADMCQIVEPKSLSLLHIALSGADLESIYASFTEQGVYIKGFSIDKWKGRRLAIQNGSFLRIPSPFSGTTHQVYGCHPGAPDSVQIGSRGRPWSVHGQADDRRLPFIRIGSVCDIDIDNSDNHRSGYINGRLENWEHLQHLGEHMVSKMFQICFRQLYDPERDWTSSLRVRSGFKSHRSFSECASFTIQDRRILGSFHAWVLKHGSSQTPDWTRRLRAKPQIYHIDLIVGVGKRPSSFTITTTQLERMRTLRIRDDADEPPAEVALLIRVVDVYSEDDISLDIFVDPWLLFDSNTLGFKNNYLLEGMFAEEVEEPTAKRLKCDRKWISWSAAATPPAKRQRGPRSLHAAQVCDTYEYLSLAQGSIRLLQLLPGTASDRLQGVIIHSSFASAAPYKALSYVWGTDERVADLLTPDGIIKITASLNHALTSIRHQAVPTLLWIDAICINQANDQEKAQQIRLLPQIFQSASCTLAFLQSSDDSDVAIEMLLQVRAKYALAADKTELEAEAASHGVGANTLDIGRTSKSVTSLDTPSGSRKRSLAHTDQDLESTETSPEGWPTDLPLVPASWKNQSIPPPEDAVWRSVAEWFSLSWFRRVWIIQEVVAARNVKIICGKWTIDWDDVHRAVELIDHRIQLYGDTEADDSNDHNDQGFFSRLQASWEPFLALAIQREWETRQVRWCLLSLLETFRCAESTLSRDRLFALLGLAADGNEAAFEPSYDAELEDVVVRFAREFVRQGRGVQLLCRAGLVRDQHYSNERFPSWVPDWTVPRQRSLHESADGETSFAAAGPEQASIRCVPDTADEIMVAGYAVDVIHSISVSRNMETEWDAYFAEVDAMIDSAVLSLTSDARDDLKWKVPIATASGSSLLSITGVDALQASYRALRDGSGFEGTGERGDSYTSALRATPHGWRFAVSKHGYVGTVPTLAKAGDDIVLIKGGLVPFILQRSETRPGATRLVGECYMHGLMNAQGLSLPGTAEADFRIH